MNSFMQIDENNPDYWQVAYERCRIKGDGSFSDVERASNSFMTSPARFQPYRPPIALKEHIMRLVA